MGAQVVNFTSLIFVTFTDFIVPLLLYVNLQQQRGEHADLSENNSTLGQELVDEGVHAHYAFPKRWASRLDSRLAPLTWLLLSSQSVRPLQQCSQSSRATTSSTCRFVRLLAPERTPSAPVGN